MSDFHLVENNGIQTLKCGAFEAIPGLCHGFSTRIGGVSRGDCAAMSFSYQKETEAVVDENYRRFCAANALPFDSLVLTHQTHSVQVRAAGSAEKGRGRFREWRDVDGLVTGEKGLGLVCFTADCVPILMADPHAKIVAAVHSGWRGTVGAIAANAVRQMVAQGASAPHILAAIGPSIGRCHFEVGPEVQKAFSSRFGAALPEIPSSREGHGMIDLWQANRLVLQEAGVLNAHIYVAEVCTFCNHDLYFSHRYTNGRRGCQLAAIAMEE